MARAPIAIERRGSLLLVEALLTGLGQLHIPAIVPNYKPITRLRPSL
jgi:hypothetical protein